MLVGRAVELDRIDGFLAAVANGPGTLLLEGELGVGKTALWRDAVARSPHRVLSCRPVEAETQLAYAALGDLLASMSDEELAALPDPQRHALEVALLRAEPRERGAPQRAVALGLLAVLRAQPTIVAVDDVQRLDHPSEVVLGFVARRLEGARVGLLVARRGGGAMPLHLPEEARLTIGPLPAGELGRMLADRSGSPVGRAELARLHRTTGGNPYYSLELLGRETLPEGLRALVADRLAALPPGGREAAALAAVLSRPTTALVDAAAAPGVLELEGTRVRFTHPLLASVAYQEAADELFISPKTVQWNLSKVYKKLGIKSRAELPVVLKLNPAIPPVSRANLQP